MRGGKTPAATAAQKERFDALHRIGCIACRLDDGQWVLPEMDHRNIGDLAGQKRTKGGHSDTLPLCIWHHRGLPWDGYTYAQMRAMDKPSKQNEKRQFFARYGRIDELYEVLQEALDGTPPW